MDLAKLLNSNQPRGKKRPSAAPIQLGAKKRPSTAPNQLGAKKRPSASPKCVASRARGEDPLTLPTLILAWNDFGLWVHFKRLLFVWMFHCFVSVSLCDMMSRSKIGELMQGHLIHFPEQQKSLRSHSAIVLAC